MAHGQRITDWRKHAARHCSRRSPPHAQRFQAGLGLATSAAHCSIFGAITTYLLPDPASSCPQRQSPRKPPIQHQTRTRPTQYSPLELSDGPSSFRGPRCSFLACAFACGFLVTFVRPYSCSEQEVSITESVYVRGSGRSQPEYGSLTAANHDRSCLRGGAGSTVVGSSDSKPILLTASLRRIRKPIQPTQKSNNGG